MQVTKRKAPKSSNAGAKHNQQMDKELGKASK